MTRLWGGGDLMAWWNRKKPEKRDLNFTDPTLWGLPGTGVNPTPDNVTGIPAVFSAVNLLSTNIAKLPVNVWRVKKDGSKELDKTHNVAKLLNIRANPYQSAFDYKRTMVNHYLLWGNAYTDLVYDDRANVKEMWLFNPASTGVVYDVVNGQIYYNTQVPILDTAVVRNEYELMHLKHYSKTGFEGISPISMAADMLGQQMGMNSFNKKFYENGTMSTQVIKTDEFLNTESKSNIRAAWEKANAGLTNAHRVAILDGGLDIQTIGMPIRDMQFVETQQFNLRQIASIFNIPAFMIGDNGGLKYSNMENQMLSFVREALEPILVMIEQEMMYKLLKPNEIGKVVIEFDTSELTQGDSLTRAQFYEKAVGKPIMSVNEARVKEGLNPVSGGDEVIAPEPEPAPVSAEPGKDLGGGDKNNENGNQKQGDNN
jgi:HK97 family phage portal protein